jgi:mono/diheme cytochrome c family protein
VSALWVISRFPSRDRQRAVVNVLAALILSATAAKAQGNILNGKELYSKYVCYACHGYSGENGLVPMRMNRFAFVKKIRHPRQMPAYSAKVISDTQLTDIYAYLKSLPNS